MLTSVRKVVALTLAVLTLSASTTFSMGIHFCGGQLESISVVSAAEPCGMQKSLPPCHRQMTPSCCEDHTIVHDGDEFNSTQSISTDLDLATEKIIPEFIFLYDLQPELFLMASTSYAASDPPLITCDRSVTFRTLLI